MSSLAILDIQHAGRASHPGDLGAQGREVPLVRQYVEHARAMLERLSAEVVVLTEGEYTERHRLAIAAVKARQPARAAYVACHLNAGGGDYGLVVHDRRSRLGEGLAKAVAWELGSGLRPPLHRVVTSWTSADAIAPYPRAYGCIRGIYAGPATLAGVLVEPCFLDCEDHAPLLTDNGLRRIGHAIALGISAWLLGRSA